MANEIRATTGLRLANGDLDSFSVSTIQKLIDQNTSTPLRVDGTQSIGTTHETIDITGLTTLGWAYFRNRDPTNYVEIGVDVAATFYPLIRLNIDESCVIRLAQGITPYARANTAAVVLERLIIDD